MGRRRRAAGRGLRLIAAHRRNRTKSRGDDGRRLRRLRRRRVVERAFARLKTCRRVAARAEHYSSPFHGFAQLACLDVAVRSF